jgi:hypothetical protein
MITSISGRKNSGKDLVGKIIQYLSIEDKYSKEYFFEQLTENPNGLNYHPYGTKWQIKKFADPLKDIVCILLGCTREQLEDQEFKETELGEKWDYFEAHTGSGRRIYARREDFPYDASHFSVQKMTPRLMLQLIGTECFREIIHPNTWINVLFNQYKPIGLYIKDITIGLPDSGKDLSTYPNWIITDCRFPNELQAVKDRGGLTIRVNRVYKDFIISDGSIVKHHEIYDNTSLHSSETALDNAEFDYVIDNDGTISELIEAVREILIKEKLISND